LPGTGHSRSPLEAHRQWLLDLVAAEPDLTLEENCCWADWCSSSW
jgi:hypothetical protein